MPSLRKLFYRKPPDGLLEIYERVHVFDCCFTTATWEFEDYKDYIGGIASQLRNHLPDASFMVFNFQGGENQSQISRILSEYDMTVVDYPRQHEGCPLLTVKMIHHYLRSSESWLLLAQQNVLLMHCEQGAWPVLAFMLAALLIYKKQFSGEQKTLEMVYRQAPPELLRLLLPINPMPSQLRYLQYISRRNLGSEWPPVDTPLPLDCIIVRALPDLDGDGECLPIVRIYGQDPLMGSDRTTKLLFSTPSRSNLVRHYKQADCQLVKIGINCLVQGDIVIEFVSSDEGQKKEELIFRFMFNTAFIRSNILILNRDEIDTLWTAKDQIPKDFRAEVLFSEMDSADSLVSIDLPFLEEKDGLPAEAFAKVREIFSNVDLSDTKTGAALDALQLVATLQENFSRSSQRAEAESGLLEATLEDALGKPELCEAKSKNRSLKASSARTEHLTPHIPNSGTKKSEPQELKDALKPVFFNEPSPDSIKEKNEPQKLRDCHRFSPSKVYVDAHSLGRNVEPQELHIAPRGSVQSEIIRQRVPQTSPSPPASRSDFLTGSSAPLSRYNAAPSALDNSALLHDHDAVDGEEERSSSLSVQSSAISSSDRNPTQPSRLTLASTRQLPPPSPCPSPNNYTEAPTTSKQLSASPVIPPQSISKDGDSLVNRHPVISVGTVESSAVPPPPFPSPSISGGSQSTIPKTPTLTPPPRPLPTDSFSGASPSENLSSAPHPPPPPPHFGSASASPNSASIPPPGSVPNAPPPPPPPLVKGLPKANDASVQSHSGINNDKVPPAPGPPCPLLGAKGRELSRANPRNQCLTRKAKLKPYHWLKLTRAMQGSLWAETQKPDEASKAPEIDMSELERFFSAAPRSDQGKGGKSSHRTAAPKSDKVQLIELRRAYNCEIMLSKVKVPLPDLMNSVLELEDSGLDADQVDTIIRFCPTKEEMELLKGYKGDKGKLGKCEQFFLELMKVPRVESKLSVFAFSLQFRSQVSDLKSNLNVINSTAEEVRSSVKLKRVMQTILSLGNALNHGTARGSAVGFRLDSLLKLTDTRARSGKMTLMHYLCKVIDEKLPELLDFPKDLVSLEAATKIQLKNLAEEMQAISKGLEKVVQELIASENDGPVSENFCKVLKTFLTVAEREVRSLTSLYSGVGRNADALATYFGEDPARCPFEQVVSTLLNFARMFVRAHEENCKQLEYEKKKADKAAEDEKSKSVASRKESEKMTRTPIRSGNLQ